MRRETTLLRWLSGMLLFGLLLGCGLLYVLSIESADAWPELAHLRLPIYLAVVVGFVPVALGITAVFDLLAVVNRGEVFSARTVQILHRLRLLVALLGRIFAAALEMREDHDLTV